MSTDKKKFVILSVARSGTSLFTSSIRNHPEIYCHGEIFHEKFKEHIRDEYRNKFGIALRNEDQVGFARSILSFSPNGEAVGFKLWQSQSPKTCDDLLADSSVSKIIIERTNKLALFSSGQLARATGVWNRLPGADVSEIRKVHADFSEQAFLRFLKRNYGLFRYYRENARGPVLDISYEQVANLHFDQVFKFLGVSILPVPAMKQRLHSEDILSRYNEECRDEVVSALRLLDKLDWLKEEL